MLHIFNKTYLDIDSRIDINTDRVVISKENGVQVGSGLDGYVSGNLIAFHESFEDTSLVEVITKIVNTKSDKKVIVYCDIENYKKFVTAWFKTIMPNLDATTFKNLMAMSLYKERAMSNAQVLENSNAIVADLRTGFGDFDDVWASTNVSESDRTAIKNLELPLSYEFMLADYFSGSVNYLSKLIKVVGMFANRWFVEALNDLRESAVLNVYNKNFQTALGFTNADVKLDSLNPLKNISSLTIFGDTTIWQQNDKKGIFGYPVLKDLTAEQLSSIKTTAKKIYDTEGMSDGQRYFEIFDLLDTAVKSGQSKDDMDKILDFVVAKPYDTCLIPVGDTDNVNYVLFHDILNKKRAGDTASLSNLALL